ncbi:Os06g0595060 [Oryza sativa Japonica Group]|uniref:Os06g0595060 protein n=1 Tax=Oryza sativa subsp. japonica TaxID=39947 RepID=A0A0P0WYB2_ORYSJ|nr:Os06g0595060 [Oryza sativa Japonica Group]
MPDVRAVALSVYSPSPVRPSEWRQRCNSSSKTRQPAGWARRRRRRLRVDAAQQRASTTAATVGQHAGGAAATVGRRGSAAGQRGGDNRWPVRKEVRWQREGEAWPWSGGLLATAG